jgi:hypothetical protein
MGRFIDSGMAIATIDPQFTRVKLVVVRNWLGGLISYPGVFGGSVVSNSCHKNRSNHTKPDN